MLMVCIPFFCNDPASTDIYTLSLHDALPICLWQLWGLAVPPFLRMIATSRLYRACVSCSWLLAVGDPGFCGADHVALPFNRMNITNANFAMKFMRSTFRAEVFES